RLSVIQEKLAQPRFRFDRQALLLEQQFIQRLNARYLDTEKQVQQRGAQPDGPTDMGGGTTAGGEKSAGAWGNRDLEKFLRETVADLDGQIANTRPRTAERWRLQGLRRNLVAFTAKLWKDTTAAEPVPGVKAFQIGDVSFFTDGRGAHPSKYIFDQ